MLISIDNAQRETFIFLSFLLLFVLASFRTRTEKGFFSTSVTQELKGFAILSVVFAHIGYYLVNDHNFLYPLSIAAGIGVNIFLFLSGFGLVMSALHKKYAVSQFYLKRLPKLYLPFWIVLAVIVLLDYLVIGRVYSVNYLLQSFSGFFPRADVLLDINSPLWYFSFIIFYYLLFPILFWRRYPWVTALALYISTYLLVESNPEVLAPVMRLYMVHTIAFPLGVFFGSQLYNFSFSNHRKTLLELISNFQKNKIVSKIATSLFFLVATLVFLYLAINSHVGDAPLREESTSILAMLSLLAIFVFSKYDNKLLHLFGVYSFEIYLLHWPLLSRFDLFYKYTDPWLATILYLCLFIILSVFLKKLTHIIARMTERILSNFLIKIKN